MSKFTYCYPSTDEKDNLTPRKPKDKEENEEGRERRSGDGRKKRKEDKDSRGEQVDHQVCIIVKDDLRNPARSKESYMHYR